MPFFFLQSLMSFSGICKIIWCGKEEDAFEKLFSFVKKPLILNGPFSGWSLKIFNMQISLTLIVSLFSLIWYGKPLCSDWLIPDTWASSYLFIVLTPLKFSDPSAESGSAAVQYEKTTAGRWHWVLAWKEPDWYVNHSKAFFSTVSIWGCYNVICWGKAVT